MLGSVVTRASPAALLVFLATDRALAAEGPLPTGAPIDSEPRPESATLPICSTERPVCVHPGNEREDTTLRALAALESAYERVVLALGLPAPLPDGGLGGSDALDAYLVPAGTAFRAVADSLAPTPFAAASASCRLPAGDPVLLERAAVQCVTEAVVMRLDPGEPPHLRRAFATWMWWLVGLPTALDVEAIHTAQAHPEMPIGARDLTITSEGAALFFEFLETHLGAGELAELGTALFSAAASPRPPAGPSYVNEPDLFDVLRHTRGDRHGSFANLMVDFAVARAFVGARDDGQHLPGLAWAGDFGRVRFDWVLPWSTLPRRVAVNPPIDSTGSVLVWLDIDRDPENAALGFRAEWEAPVSFHWQLVRLDENGIAVGRMVLPYRERGTEAEATLENLAGVRAVIAVGTNLETVSLAHPFDPDVAPFEPHGVTVYFARL